MTREYRIFDTDTHVGPQMEVLHGYLPKSALDRLGQFEQWKRTDYKGQTIYTMGRRNYTRRLGTAGDSEQQVLSSPNDSRSATTAPTVDGGERSIEPSPGLDLDPAARIHDMDLEGVDVNLMLPSGWFGTWTAVDDVELEQDMYAAYHEWMRDYCAAFPSRLTGVLLVSGRDVASGVKQIASHAGDRWPLGILCYTPEAMPLDHPDLEPLWSAAAEANLSVVLHTFTVMPPYAPGGLDTWGNAFLQRSTAHPWSGQRAMACVLASGLLDRHPGLRVGVLEAGHGWLPGWVKRLDEHTRTVGSSIPNLEMLPSEYVKSGRYFQSIEMSEGREVTQAVIDILGDDILMYASDYPHGESWYPNSVKTVEDWDLAPVVARKLFWDNPVRFYAKYDD